MLLSGGWWDNNGNCNEGTGVESLSACLGAAFSTATIVNTADGLGGVRFDVGFAGDTDVFNGYVDNFTIGINNVNTTYNFDPSSRGSSSRAVDALNICCRSCWCRCASPA